MESLLNIKEKTDDIASCLVGIIPELTDPGLLKGKMGLAIFFFHYARYVKEESFEDIGMELVDSILQNVSTMTSEDYGSGLAGIGTGIEYLIQNKFISRESDDILSDFDRIILDRIMYQENPVYGLEKGLYGIGKYFLYRIKEVQNGDKETRTLLNRQNLIYLLDILDDHKKRTLNCREEALFFLSHMYAENIFNVKVEKLMRYYLQNESMDREHLLETLLSMRQRLYDDKQGYFLNTNFSLTNPSSVGLQDGYAGLGLTLLTRLNSLHRYWMELIL
jgi:lantibiotic modifying enzyme